MSLFNGLTKLVENKFKEMIQPPKQEEKKETKSTDIFNVVGSGVVNAMNGLVKGVSSVAANTPKFIDQATKVANNVKNEYIKQNNLDKIANSILYNTKKTETQEIRESIFKPKLNKIDVANTTETHRLYQALDSLKYYRNNNNIDENEKQELAKYENEIKLSLSKKDKNFMFNPDYAVNLQDIDALKRKEEKEKTSSGMLFLQWADEEASKYNLHYVDRINNLFKKFLPGETSEKMQKRRDEIYEYAYQDEIEEAKYNKGYSFKDESFIDDILAKTGVNIKDNINWYTVGRDEAKGENLMSNLEDKKNKKQNILNSFNIDTRHLLGKRQVNNNIIEYAKIKGDTEEEELQKYILNYKTAIELNGMDVNGKLVEENVDKWFLYQPSDEELTKAGIDKNDEAAFFAYSYRKAKALKGDKTKEYIDKMQQNLIEINNNYTKYNPEFDKDFVVEDGKRRKASELIDDYFNLDKAQEMFLEKSAGMTRQKYDELNNKKSDYYELKANPQNFYRNLEQDENFKLFKNIVQERIADPIIQQKVLQKQKNAYYKYAKNFSIIREKFNGDEATTQFQSLKTIFENELKANELFLAGFEKYEKGVKDGTYTGEYKQNINKAYKDLVKENPEYYNDILKKSFNNDFDQLAYNTLTIKERSELGDGVLADSVEGLYGAVNTLTTAGEGVLVAGDRLGNYGANVLGASDEDMQLDRIIYDADSVYDSNLVKIGRQAWNYKGEILGAVGTLGSGLVVKGGAKASAKATNLATKIPILGKGVKALDNGIKSLGDVKILKGLDSSLQANKVSKTKELGKVNDEIAELQAKIAKHDEGVKVLGESALNKNKEKLAALETKAAGLTDEISTIDKTLDSNRIRYSDILNGKVEGTNIDKINMSINSARDFIATHNYANNTLKTLKGIKDNIVLDAKIDSIFNHYLGDNSLDKGEYDENFYANLIGNNIGRLFSTMSYMMRDSESLGDIRNKLSRGDISAKAQINDIKKEYYNKTNIQLTDEEVLSMFGKFTNTVANTRIKNIDLSPAMQKEMIVDAIRKSDLEFGTSINKQGYIVDYNGVSGLADDKRRLTYLSESYETNLRKLEEIKKQIDKVDSVTKKKLEIQSNVLEKGLDSIRKIMIDDINIYESILKGDEVTFKNLSKGKNISYLGSELKNISRMRNSVEVADMLGKIVKLKEQIEDGKKLPNKFLRDATDINQRFRNFILQNEKDGNKATLNLYDKITGNKIEVDVQYLLKVANSRALEKGIEGNLKTLDDVASTFSDEELIKILDEMKDNIKLDNKLVYYDYVNDETLKARRFYAGSKEELKNLLKKYGINPDEDKIFEDGTKAVSDKYYSNKKEQYEFGSDGYYASLSKPKEEDMIIKEKIAEFKDGEYQEKFSEMENEISSILSTAGIRVDISELGLKYNTFANSIEKNINKMIKEGRTAGGYNIAHTQILELLEPLGKDDKKFAKVFQEIIDVIANKELYFYTQILSARYGEDFFNNNVINLGKKHLHYDDVLEQNYSKESFINLNYGNLTLSNYKSDKLYSYEYIMKKKQSKELFANNLYYLLPGGKLDGKQFFEDIQKKIREEGIKDINKVLREYTEGTKRVLEIVDNIGIENRGKYSELIDTVLEDINFNKEYLINRLFKEEQIDKATQVIDYLEEVLLKGIHKDKRETFIKNLVYNYARNFDFVNEVFDNIDYSKDFNDFVYRLFVSEGMIGGMSRKITNINDVEKLSENEKLIYDVVKEDYVNYLKNRNSELKGIDSSIKKVSGYISDLEDKLSKVDIEDRRNYYEVRFLENQLKSLKIKEQELINKYKTIDKEILDEKSYIEVSFNALLTRVNRDEIIQHGVDFVYKMQSKALYEAIDGLRKLGIDVSGLDSNNINQVLEFYEMAFKNKIDNIDDVMIDLYYAGKEINVEDEGYIIKTIKTIKENQEILERSKSQSMKEIGILEILKEQYQKELYELKSGVHKTETEEYNKLRKIYRDTFNIFSKSNEIEESKRSEILLDIEKKEAELENLKNDKSGLGEFITEIRNYYKGNISLKTKEALRIQKQIDEIEFPKGKNDKEAVIEKLIKNTENEINKLKEINKGLKDLDNLDLSKRNAEIIEQVSGLGEISKLLDYAKKIKYTNENVSKTFEEIDGILDMYTKKEFDEVIVERFSSSDGEQLGDSILRVSFYNPNKYDEEGELIPDVFEINETKLLDSSLLVDEKAKNFILNNLDKVKLSEKGFTDVLDNFKNMKSSFEKGKKFNSEYFFESEIRDELYTMLANGIFKLGGTKGLEMEKVIFDNFRQHYFTFEDFNKIKGELNKYGLLKKGKINKDNYFEFLENNEDVITILAKKQGTKLNELLNRRKNYLESINEKTVEDTIKALEDDNTINEFINNVYGELFNKNYFLIKDDITEPVKIEGYVNKQKIFSRLSRLLNYDIAESKTFYNQGGKILEKITPFHSMPLIYNRLKNNLGKGRNIRYIEGIDVKVATKLLSEAGLDSNMVKQLNPLDVLIKLVNGRNLDLHNYLAFDKETETIIYNLRKRLGIKTGEIIVGGFGDKGGKFFIYSNSNLDKAIPINWDLIKAKSPSEIEKLNNKNILLDYFYSLDYITAAGFHNGEKAIELFKKFEKKLIEKLKDSEDYKKTFEDILFGNKFAEEEFLGYLQNGKGADKDLKNITNDLAKATTEEDKYQVRKKYYTKIINATKKREASHTSEYSIYEGLKTKVNMYVLAKKSDSELINRLDDIEGDKEFYEEFVKFIEEKKQLSKEIIALAKEGKNISTNARQGFSVHDYAKIDVNKMFESITFNGEIDYAKARDYISNTYLNDLTDGKTIGTQDLGRLLNFLNGYGDKILDNIKSHIEGVDEFGSLFLGKNNITVSSLVNKIQGTNKELLNSSVFIGESSLKNRGGFREFSKDEQFEIEVDGIRYTVIGEKPNSTLDDFKNASSLTHEHKEDVAVSSLIETFDYEIGNKFVEIMGSKIEKELSEYLGKQFDNKGLTFGYTGTSRKIVQALKSGNIDMKSLIFSSAITKEKYARMEQIINKHIEKPTTKGAMHIIQNVDISLGLDDVVIHPFSDYAKKLFKDNKKQIEQAFKDNEMEWSKFSKYKGEEKIKALEILNNLDLYTVTTRFPVSDPYVTGLYKVKFRTNMGTHNIITHPEATFIKARGDFDGDKLFLYSLNDDVGRLLAHGVLSKAGRGLAKDLVNLNYEDTINFINDIYRNGNRINKYIIAKEVEKGGSEGGIEDFTISISRAASLLAKQQINNVSASNRTLNIFRNVLGNFYNIFEHLDGDEFNKAFKEYLGTVSIADSQILKGVNDLINNSSNDKGLTAIINNTIFNFETEYKNILRNFIRNNIRMKTDEVSSSIYDRLETIFGIKFSKEDFLKASNSKDINGYINDIANYIYDKVKNIREINNNKDVNDLHFRINGLFKGEEFTLNILKENLPDGYDIKDINNILDIPQRIEEGNKYLYNGRIINKEGVNKLKNSLLDKGLNPEFSYDINYLNVNSIIEKINKINFNKENDVRNIREITNIKEFKQKTKELIDGINSEDSLIERANLTNLTLDFGNSGKVTFPIDWLDNVLLKSGFKEQDLDIAKTLVEQISMGYGSEIKYNDLNSVSGISGAKGRIANLGVTYLKPLNDIKNISVQDSFFIREILNSFKDIKFKEEVILDGRKISANQGLTLETILDKTLSSIQTNTLNNANNFLKVEGLNSALDIMNNINENTNAVLLDLLMNGRGYFTNKKGKLYASSEKDIKGKEDNVNIGENLYTIYNDFYNDKHIQELLGDVKSYIYSFKHGRNNLIIKDFFDNVKEKRISNIINLPFIYSFLKRNIIDNNNEGFLKIEEYYKRLNSVSISLEEPKLLKDFSKEYQMIKYSLLTINRKLANNKYEGFFEEEIIKHINSFFYKVEKKLNDASTSEETKAAIGFMLKSFSKNEIDYIKELTGRKRIDVLDYLSYNTLEKFLKRDIQTQVNAFTSDSLSSYFPGVKADIDFMINEMNKRINLDDMLEYVKGLKENLGKSFDIVVEKTKADNYILLDELSRNKEELKKIEQENELAILKNESLIKEKQEQIKELNIEKKNLPVQIKKEQNEQTFKLRDELTKKQNEINIEKQKLEKDLAFFKSERVKLNEAIKDKDKEIRSLKTQNFSFSKYMKTSEDLDSSLKKYSKEFGVTIKFLKNKLIRDREEFFAYILFRKGIIDKETYLNKENLHSLDLIKKIREFDTSLSPIEKNNKKKIEIDEELNSLFQMVEFEQAIDFVNKQDDIIVDEYRKYLSNEDRISKAYYVGESYGDSLVESFIKLRNYYSKTKNGSPKEITEDLLLSTKAGKEFYDEVKNFTYKDEYSDEFEEIYDTLDRAIPDVTIKEYKNYSPNSLTFEDFIFKKFKEIISEDKHLFLNIQKNLEDNYSERNRIIELERVLKVYDTNIKKSKGIKKEKERIELINKKIDELIEQDYDSIYIQKEKEERNIRNVEAEIMGLNEELKIYNKDLQEIQEHNKAIAFYSEARANKIEDLNLLEDIIREKKAIEDKVKNISIETNEVSIPTKTDVKRYTLQNKTMGEIESEIKEQNIDLIGYWNNNVADAVADDLRGRANVMKGLFTTSYIQDIKSKDRELYDTINGYSYIVGTNREYITEQRMLFNKLSQLINSITIQGEKNVSGNYYYKSRSVAFNKDHEFILEAMKNKITKGFRGKDGNYYFDEEVFQKEFEKSIKTHFSHIIQNLEIDELDALRNYYKGKNEFTLGEYYAYKLQTSQHFKDVFNKYKEDIIYQAEVFLNKIDKTFGNNRNILYKYRGHRGETISNIIEDIVGTMKGDNNLALIDLGIHSETMFIKRLTDKGFTLKQAKVLYSGMVDNSKHGDDFIWNLLNTLSYSVKYGVGNLTHLGGTIAGLQQGPGQWTEIRSKMKAYNINYDDLVKLQNRYGFVRDEDTLTFSNVIGLQNNTGVFTEMLKLNSIVDKMLVNDNSIVKNAGNKLRQLLDAGINPLGYNDHFFDMDRRLAGLSRAMYNSGYNSYDEVVNGIYTFGEKELLRLQSEARYFYNELGGGVSSKSGVYKMNKLFNRSGKTNLNDKWNSLYYNPIMGVIKRFYESIGGFMTSWSVNKFNNTLIELPQLFVKGVVNGDEYALRIVAKELQARFLNTMYLFMLGIKMDKYQDDDVKSDKMKIIEMLHNDFVAFSSVMSPILKTIRMANQNEYDILSSAGLISYNLADRFINSPTVVSTLFHSFADEINNRNYADKEGLDFIKELFATLVVGIHNIGGKTHRFTGLENNPYDLETLDKKFSLTYALGFGETGPEALKINDVWETATDYNLYAKVFNPNLSATERGQAIFEGIFGWKSKQSLYNQENAKLIAREINHNPLLASIKNSEVDINKLFYEIVNNPEYYVDGQINLEEAEKNKNNLIRAYHTYFNKWFPDKSLGLDGSTKYKLSEIEAKQNLLVEDIYNKSIIGFQSQPDDKNKIKDFGTYFYNQMLKAGLGGDNANLPVLNHKLYSSLVNKYEYEIYKKAFPNNKTDKGYAYTRNNYYFDEAWKSLPKNHNYRLTAYEAALKEMGPLLNNDVILNQEILKTVTQMNDKIQKKIYNKTGNYLDFYPNNAEDSIVDKDSGKTRKQLNEENEEKGLLTHFNKYKNKNDKNSDIGFAYLNKAIERTAREKLAQHSEHNRISPYLGAFSYTDLAGKNAIMKLLNNDEKQEVVFQYLALTNDKGFKELKNDWRMGEFIKNNKIDEKLVDYLYTINDDINKHIEENDPDSLKNTTKAKGKYSKKKYNKKEFVPYKKKDYKKDGYEGGYGKGNGQGNGKNPIQQFISDNRDKLSDNPYKVKKELDTLNPFEIKPGKATINFIQGRLFNLVLPGVDYDKFIVETGNNNFGDNKIPKVTVINKKQKFLKTNAEKNNSKNNNSKNNNNGVKSQIKKTRISNGGFYDGAFNIKT